MRRIAIALLGLLFVCCAQAQVGPGDIPPDELGNTLDGQDVTLSALQGKVVVISFWASWCGYCMKEMPMLAALQATAAARGLPLQVIAIDYREDHGVFAQNAQVLQARLPSLLISWDGDGRIGEPYGTHDGIPLMVMLHRDGTVAHVHAGYSENMFGSLLAEINVLLREPVPPGVTVN